MRVPANGPRPSVALVRTNALYDESRIRKKARTSEVVTDRRRTHGSFVPLSAALISFFGNVRMLEYLC